MCHSRRRWQAKPTGQLVEQWAYFRVRAELDENRKGIKVSDAQMTVVHFARHSFHGEWNYTIAPREAKKHLAERSIDRSIYWTGPNLSRGLPMVADVERF
jgi:DDE family transposase